MEIKINSREMSHLIEKAPLNHIVSIGYYNSVLTTTEDSWEYKELMRLRKEPSVEADKKEKS